MRYPMTVELLHGYWCQYQDAVRERSADASACRELWLQARAQYDPTELVMLESRSTLEASERAWARKGGE